MAHSTDTRRSHSISSLLIGTTITAILKDKIVYIADLKFGALSEITGLPKDIVVMTDEDCSSLGRDWQTFKPMEGRFPLRLVRPWTTGKKQKSLR